mmetsp:Transcript_317/g.766  ORF Transcript_317/g.766 Transcript_317/m.766 type:complete len:105 (+) Transcript_317:866-1180(+)
MSQCVCRLALSFLILAPPLRLSPLASVLFNVTEEEIVVSCPVGAAREDRPNERRVDASTVFVEPKWSLAGGCRWRLTLNATVVHQICLLLDMALPLLGQTGSCW